MTKTPIRMNQKDQDKERETFTQLVSSTTPDWSREKCRTFWDPSRKLLKSIRAYQHLQKNNGCLKNLYCKWFVLQHRFWSVITGADIPLNCRLGGGLLLPHPNGVVIHPGSKIGPNCLIFQQVTIVRGVSIGGHVDIGTGAKIIKPVSIGDHVRIGANAVVVKNISGVDIVVGVPAVSINT